ncbi:MAG TPA: serine/threonine-protein kinase [Kofleriaceae bacterium]|nr:serine/threonine-protein kinase [Kofleriaceae bacterium]
MAGIPFGKYQLVKRLARGGMAEVFLAKQSGPEGFNRLVALKRILPHLVDSQDFVRMFLDEARLAAQLSHPNVVHIYDFGKVDEHYFIAMEYVPGVHAGTLIKQAEKERLPDVLVARIGADACAGLNYAHELRDVDGRALQLVHRDVSPPNLLVSYDGAVKLVDFGIAKAVSCVEQTRPGVVKGKFAYMSPEQTIGQKLDGRSDVFSLAILLWELLAGKIMVPRTDPIEGMRMIRDCRFPPIEKERPDLPGNLAAAIGRALKNKREERATAVELGRALEEFIKNSADGIGSSLELAQWIRDRFPRENLSEMQRALRDEPAGTRPATGATRAAPPSTQVVDDDDEDENSPTVDSAIRAPASATAGVVTSASAPSELPALRASSPPSGFRRHPTTGDSTSAHVIALPAEERPTMWGSPSGRAHAGVVMEPLAGVQSSSVIVADDWVLEDERTAPPDTVSMDETFDGELDDMTMAQGEPTQNDLTRILSHGTGSAAAATPSSGHTGALTRPGRGRGIAILVAAGAAAGVFGAVLLSSDGSDARSEPDGEAEVEVAAAAAPVERPSEPPPTATRTATAATSGEPPGAPAPAGATPPEDATLDVVTRPEGARVVLGELAPLTSPAHFDKVPPGRYDVRVELKGHTTLARSVELAAGEHRSLELDLDPVGRPPATAPVGREEDGKKKKDVKEKAVEKRVPPPPPRDGTVKIRTRPYSEVYLGSRRLGQTPLIKELKPGKYTLVFKHPGKPNVKKTVVIKPGEATKLDFALD